MSMRIRSIYRYPVKGLSPAPLGRTTLAPQDVLPHDRRFALARPGCRFDPESPHWLPKTEFYMLCRDEKLARLQTHFDPADGRLAIHSNGSLVEAASLVEPEGRRTIEQFFAEFLDGEGAAAPRLVSASGHAFTDASLKPGSSTYKYVSLQNLASIAALEKVVGAPVDPLRFRANFYIDGIPGWSELDWVGREIRIGTARLKVVSPTARCAATMVNPTTGDRDLNIPQTLKLSFGHINMGVYAEVVDGGEVIEGATVSEVA